MILRCPHADRVCNSRHQPPGSLHRRRDARQNCYYRAGATHAHRHEDCAEAKRISECDTHSGGVAPYAPNRPMPRALQQTFANLTRLRPERPDPAAAARSPAHRGCREMILNHIAQHTHGLQRSYLSNRSLARLLLRVRRRALAFSVGGGQGDKRRLQCPAPIYRSPCGDALALRDGLRSCRDAL